MYYYLGFGANLGDKCLQINQSYKILEKKIGRLIVSSSFYETEPWGYESDNHFLNSVALFESKLQPLEVLQVTQNTEKILGRKIKSVNRQYHDRLIDIDLLLVLDDNKKNICVHTDTLIIPHPYITERLFVLEPLCEIAPDLFIPNTKQNIRELFQAQWQKHNMLI